MDCLFLIHGINYWSNIRLSRMVTFAGLVSTLTLVRDSASMKSRPNVSEPSINVSLIIVRGTQVVFLILATPSCKGLARASCNIGPMYHHHLYRDQDVIVSIIVHT